MKPSYLAAAHRRICQKAKCQHLDKIDYADPAVGCPDGHYVAQSGPPMHAVLLNGARAIGQVMRHGATKVSEEEQARRLAICNTCEFFDTKILPRASAKTPRCLKCGCYVNWKSRLEAWHCPIQKW